MKITARRSITKAVVDTGPLFTALTLHYVQMIQAPEVKRKSILNHAVDPDLYQDRSRQQDYLQLFGSLKPLLITSHVIGELQGLQHSCLGLKGDDLRSFWSHSMDFLRFKGVGEELVRLLDLERLQDIVYDLGPTDTGLIHLALQQGCLLLTNDRTLKQHAQKLQVDCELVKDVIDPQRYW